MSESFPDKQDIENVSETGDVLKTREIIRVCNSIRTHSHQCM
jgi:hypothetical protein